MRHEHYKTWAEIPAEYRAALKWSGGVSCLGDTVASHASCAAWEYKDGILHLTGAVIDTSRRVNGVCLEPQLTYLEDGYYGGQMWFHFHPLPPAEGKE